MLQGPPAGTRTSGRRVGNGHHARDRECDIGRHDFALSGHSIHFFTRWGNDAVSDDALRRASRAARYRAACAKRPAVRSAENLLRHGKFVWSISVADIAETGAGLA